MNTNNDIAMKNPETFPPPPDMEKYEGSPNFKVLQDICKNESKEAALRIFDESVQCLWDLVKLEVVLYDERKRGYFLPDTINYKEDDWIIRGANCMKRPSWYLSICKQDQSEDDNAHYEYKTEFCDQNELCECKICSAHVKKMWENDIESIGSDEFTKRLPLSWEDMEQDYETE